MCVSVHMPAQNQAHHLFDRVGVCVCVCMCVRACMRAYVRVCARGSVVMSVSVAVCSIHCASVHVTDSPRQNQQNYGIILRQFFSFFSLSLAFFFLGGGGGRGGIGLILVSSANNQTTIEPSKNCSLL